MMKFLSNLAAASLALTPAIASAGSGGDSTASTASTDSTADSRPISGPLAARPRDDVVPAGAILLFGSLLIFGGAIFLLLDSNNDSN